MNYRIVIFCLIVTGISFAEESTYNLIVIDHSKLSQEIETNRAVYYLEDKDFIHESATDQIMVFYGDYLYVYYSQYDKNAEYFLLIYFIPEEKLVNKMTISNFTSMGIYENHLYMMSNEEIAKYYLSNPEYPKLQEKAILPNPDNYLFRTYEFDVVNEKIVLNSGREIIILDTDLNILKNFSVQPGIAVIVKDDYEENYLFLDDLTLKLFDFNSEYIAIKKIFQFHDISRFVELNKELYIISGNEFYHFNKQSHKIKKLSVELRDDFSLNYPYYFYNNSVYYENRKWELVKLDLLSEDSLSFEILKNLYEDGFIKFYISDRFLFLFKFSGNLENYTSIAIYDIEKDLESSPPILEIKNTEVEGVQRVIASSDKYTAIQYFEWADDK